MLRRVVRVELEVFVSVCGFPVDTGFYCSIGIPGCLGAQECDGSVFWLILCSVSLISAENLQYAF